ncbi:MAG: hypothetical protein ACFFD9_10265 [Candidatus Thorarchaeota archaeon]
MSRDEIGFWTVIAAINVQAFAGVMILGWTTNPSLQNNTAFTSISYILLIIGSFLLIAGVCLWGMGPRSVREEDNVLEIAAMRKRVTLAELHRETNLPRDTIERILRDALLNQRLFGFLEDDEFVRDTSVSPWKRDMDWVINED